MDSIDTADADDDASAVGRTLTDRGWRAAVAESLTGGLLAQRLARVKGSGDWFLGGVVAYQRSVKHDLLDVGADKVVSARAAEEMARGVRRLLHADVAVAVTGVAGPTRQDGEPPGTVFVAVASDAGVRSEHHELPGPPSEVVEQAVDASVRLLRTHLDALAAGSERDAPRGQV